MHPNTDIVSAVGVLAWAVATVVCLLIPSWHEGDRWWWPWTAAAGVVFSLLLALLSWLMINGRERALRLAAAMTEELRHMAQHDPLTDLPNRALFSDRLSHELARAKRQRGRFAR